MYFFKSTINEFNKKKTIIKSGQKTDLSLEIDHPVSAITQTRVKDIKAVI